MFLMSDTPGGPVPPPPPTASYGVSDFKREGCSPKAWEALVHWC